MALFWKQRQYDLDRYPVVFIGTKTDQGEVLQVRNDRITDVTWLGICGETGRLLSEFEAGASAKDLNEEPGFHQWDLQHYTCGGHESVCFGYAQI